MEKPEGHCNHFYEVNPGSGMFVYMLDEDKPVYMKFSSMIRIKVVLDSLSSCLDDSNDKRDFSGGSLWEGEVQTAFTVLKNQEHAEDCEESLDITRECDEIDNGMTGGCSPTEEQRNTDVKRRPQRTSKRTRKVALANLDSELIVKRKKQNIAKTEAKGHKRKKKTVHKAQMYASGRRKRNTSTRSSAYKGKTLVTYSDLRSQSSEDAWEASSNSATEKRGAKYHLGLNKKLGTELKRSVGMQKKVLASSDASSKKLRVDKKRDRKEKGHKLKENRCEELRDQEVRLQPQQRTKKLLAEKSVNCKYCEKQFPNQQAFFDHRRAEESSHKCEICGKVEPYQAHLIVHMQKHEPVKVDRWKKITGESQNLDTSETGDALISREKAEVAASKNQVCEEKDSQDLESNDNYGRKKNKKEPMKCKVCCLVVSSTDSLKIHTMLHTGEYAYRCCVCGEKFSSLSSRQHHMDIHMSAERFKCNPCGERFVSRAELAKHQLTHEIKCALCGEVFPNKTSRSCHYRVSHPDDILKCMICSTMFATQEDLSKHLIYHRKGKKEQCPVCGVVVSKLKDHMLLHTKQPQEKLYACDQCPMRYLRKSNLDRHMLIHSGEKPYACDRCTKRFRSNGMLRKHLLTHTQEKPYQCEVCGKRCSLRSNLNIHMRVHNNDKKYPCLVCRQAFNHKNSLLGHLRSKHSQEGKVDQRSRYTNNNIISELPPQLPAGMGSDLGVITDPVSQYTPSVVPTSHYTPNLLSSSYTPNVELKPDSRLPSSSYALTMLEHVNSGNSVPASYIPNITVVEKSNSSAMMAMNYLPSVVEKPGSGSKDLAAGMNLPTSLPSNMLIDENKYALCKYSVNPQSGQGY